MGRIKLTHVIGRLDMAGAERVLYTLLARCNPQWFDSEVITLIQGGPLEPAIQSLGIQVRSLRMRPGQVRLRPIRQLATWLRERSPDCVVTWMYHSNLLAGLAARLAGGIPVVWNIRNNDLPANASKWLTRWTSRCCGRLSRRIADRVVFVSQSGRQWHTDRGYATDNSSVIPNGFDVNIFRPDPTARIEVRREMGLAADVPLIGLVARFHAQKDHQNFVAAAAQIHVQRPDVRFLLCGHRVNRENRQLARGIAAAGIGKALHLLGERRDMPRLHASLDVAVSSSASEAFSSAIGEAMACGVPCAVTDVGDSAVLVGSTGRVVPPRDSDALAAACLELISLPAQHRATLGALARERIAGQFNLDRVAEQHFSLWAECARQFTAGKIEINRPTRRAA